MDTQIKRTPAEELKGHLLAHLKEFIQDAREDIETGIEDGIYDDDDDNKELLKKLDALDKEVEVFEKYRPAVYIMVEGGMIQGASVSEAVELNIYDMDNAQSDPNYEREHGRPEQWDNEIKRLTENGTIRPTL